ncbi:MAG: hypothetical protein U0892_10100 [Pirellulales bacterium]
MPLVLGPGEFQLGARKIRVGEDKCARSPDGEHFVGAASTMVDNDEWLAEKVSLTAQQRHTLLYEESAELVGGSIAHLLSFPSAVFARGVFFTRPWFGYR